MSRSVAKTTTTVTVTKTSTPAPAVSASNAALQKYVKQGLGLDQISKLKECFDMFDYDRSGNISPFELRTTIKMLGLEGDAQKILSLVNQHSQGEQIDFEGFLEIFGFSADGKSETTLQSLFEEFDKDGKGHFTEVEFGKVCDSLGERFSDNEILAMIQYGDKDKDGVINYSDFVEVVTKEYPRP